MPDFWGFQLGERDGELFGSVSWGEPESSSRGAGSNRALLVAAAVLVALIWWANSRG